jgi:hypothetical protein
VLLVPSRNQRARKAHVKESVEESFRRVRIMSTQKRWERFFFRPVEAFNAIWLVSLLTQTSILPLLVEKIVRTL